MYRFVTTVCTPVPAAPAWQHSSDEGLGSKELGPSSCLIRSSAYKYRILGSSSHSPAGVRLSSALMRLAGESLFAGAGNRPRVNRVRPLHYFSEFYVNSETLADSLRISA